ncbi:MAG TPA: type II toxin-antitoxin system RelE/ParE family toxin [Longimicrobium sp.]|nr:type II toxin-antitoxin system RelE/ParE family toxin [Longimicrobium sp.]
MEIIETRVFTSRVMELLTEDEYHALQQVLLARPEVGAVIAGTGGVRKARWGLAGRGKSGGVRVIYYWAVAPGVLLMLYIYPKNEQEDLTPAQKAALRRVVEREYGGAGASR